LDKNLKSKFIRYLRNSNLFISLIHWREFKKSKLDSDFSQFGEQKIIQNLVPSHGFYLDIGSGRPVSGSNSYFLYKRGWSGILVDPIKTNIRLSKRLRPRDSSILAIVGSDKRNFYEFYPYEYSTISPEIAMNLIKENVHANLISVYEVESVSAEDLYLKLPKNSFRFVNIDAEGYDFEILNSLNLKQNRPDLICVEDWEYETTIESKITRYLRNCGYILEARVGLSSIFRSLLSGGGGI
jgi:Methyltransferase FkbM domain